LFPAEFRGDFGDEMTQVFDDERADASRQGGMASARLWYRTITGVAEVASREHIRSRAPHVVDARLWHSSS